MKDDVKETPQIEPGETHAVFNQPPALEAHNLYLTDAALVDGIHREGASWADDDLRRFGRECGDPGVIELGYLADANPPEFDTHDRFGHRVDEVHYHPAYHQLMDRALREELHSAPWKRPGADRKSVV